MIHIYFDLLAIVLSIWANQWFRKKYQIKHSLIEDEENYYWYLLSAIVGLFIGAYVFGTLNLVLSGHEGIGKSFLGGVFGAVLSIEVFKYFKGYKTSTGLYYISGICILIIVGRLGCFFSGLNDFTYGIATDSSLAYDFGDGIGRHPVQLYESFSILVFLLLFLLSYAPNKTFWYKKGFYLFILVYATQRFIWEFLKPYEVVFLKLNIFHILTIILIIWSSLKLVTNNYDNSINS